MQSSSRLSVLLPLLVLGCLPSMGHTQGLTMERWTGVSGSDMQSAYTAIGSRAPNSVTLTSAGAEIGQTSPNLGNLVHRMRGMLTIPADGDYTFWVSGDDDVDLWLSLDASRFNKKLIAFNRGWNTLRNFTQNATQRSSIYRLKAGQICYLEALNKEAAGFDHLSVGWTSVGLPTTTVSSIGTVVSQSWVVQSDGSMQVSVDAGDVTGVSDHAGFQGTSWTGDGEIVVRLRDMTLPTTSAKMGVMLRSSLNVGAQMAAIVQTSGRNMLWQRRLTNDVALANSTITGSFDWMKLRREGELVTAFGSLDGMRWFNLGSATLTGLPATLFVGISAADGSATATVPVTGIVSNFQTLSLAAPVPQVIPAQHLAPVVAEPLDANNDGLPDAWQVANGLSATGFAYGSSAYGDPDEDDRTNLHEYQNGSNPTVAERLQGHLAVQRWNNTAYYNVAELVRDPIFLGQPSSVFVTAMAEVRDQPINSGSRVRGYITAPATGSYRFWIAGCDGVELWLSTDVTKFRKQRLSFFGADTGAGDGISDTTNPFAAWDRFSTQMSAPVALVAGQKYFFEMLCSSTHSGLGWVSAAWAMDGGTRVNIPSAALESYLHETTDADDDYLLDTWETAQGLNPMDNGIIDSARQGEWGDFDGDTLTNREEFLLGTSPTDDDTDNDGVSDSEELRFYGTSPTVSNSITQTQVDCVPLTSYNPTLSSGTWQVFDGGLLGSSFRGRINWTVTVPTDGWWMVDLEARLRGTLRAYEQLPISLKVDGQTVEPQTMTFTNGEAAHLKVVMPWLTAGSHQVTFDIDNDMGRRTLQIIALQVLSCGGFDGNGNGRSDWLDAVLASKNSLAPGSSVSLVSPAFIEGSVRHSGGVVGTVSGQTLNVQRGLGDLHWFANAPLAQTGSSPIQVQFESGSVIQNRTVTWDRWNALGTGTLTIRVGDSVKIGAWKSTTDTGTSSITVAGVTYPGISAASGFVVQTFTAAGTYPVRAVPSSGTAKTLNIIVIGAELAEAQAFYADWATWRTFAGSSNSLFYDSEPSLVIQAKRASGTGVQLQLLAKRNGTHAIAARLSAAGPIIAMGTVSTVGISDALTNDAAVFLGTTNDGYSLLRSPIVVSDLPPGGRVVLTIFRAGVSFLDGTTVKTLVASDLVEGVAYLDFRYPQGMTGGYCHYIDVYDGQNRYLGRH
jgi:PA14 domain